MRLFDKEWIGDNKGWGYAFERIKLLAVERNDAREALQRRDRLDEAELDGIAAALDGQGADSCSLSDPAERETWLLGYNSEAELLRLRRERDEAREALRMLCQFTGWNDHRKWLDKIPMSRDVEAAVQRVLGEEGQPDEASIYSGADEE